ncbi:Ras-related gtp-binding protein, putative [Ichthyophthirius multifiliis]|uniref:Ras-related gtp-binding protein, putative n=1 Tax=Ichthyophthirius multifiliis TaxID=5932 RepID=G0QY10_ICHMU|nr:Ras-related gtp-binding protein, putative [Ichthyophthirius multifiliis]EGR29879.1 Ras-related gtp-binding protein, putative [Ichthyophthirius multifiliis]|eukprot:XP_004031115.1 Ras-related gtp-binding protein, putative [Ichthyophthirius multifiliis]
MKIAKEKVDTILKLLIIGDSTVGKTCIALRFCDDKFSLSHTNTVGIDFQLKYLEIQGKKIKLQIWDTAGQEKYRTITQNYYKGAHGILLVYSVQNKNSFLNVENWLYNIKEHSDNQNVCIFLVGNKCDSKEEERQVTKQDGEILAKQYNLPFLETSALNNINIYESFIQLSKMGIEQIELNQQNQESKPLSIINFNVLQEGYQKNTNKINLQSKQQKQKKKCCN